MKLKNKDDFLKIISIIFNIILTYVINEGFYLAIMTEYQKFFPGLNIPHQIYNLIIYSCFYLILYSLINRIFIVNIISFVFYYVIIWISSTKFICLLSPLWLTDIEFLSSAGGGVLTIGMASLKSLFFISLGVYAFWIWSYLFICYIMKMFKKDFFKVKISKKNRIYLFFISIISLTLLLSTFVFNLFINYRDSSFFSNGEYSRNGFFVGIFGSHKGMKIEEPINYDEENIENLLSNYASKKEVENWGKPNVIFVLSEAFFDISNVQEITFNKDIYENYNYVKENAIHFKPLTGVYAGRTGNVEFEVNTLSSLRYLSDAYVPFNSLYDKDSMVNYPSVPHIFKENGYITNIYSPFDDGNFYRVREIYELIGYDNRYFESDLEERANLLNNNNYIKGFEVSDNFLIDFVIDNIENNDNPSFSFIKTVQNHMPYYPSKFGDNLIIEASSNSKKYSKEELGYFSSYGQGIYDNGLMLKKLYDYIQETKEPTIVFFFGDHLPNLFDYDSSIDLLAKSNYLTGENELNNYLNKYSTDALIFSNFDMGNDEIPKSISFDEIIAYLMKHLNLETKYTSYIDYLYDSIDILPSCNRFINVNKDGKITLTKDLTNEEFKVYNMREQIQYYLLNKYNFSVEGD